LVMGQTPANQTNNVVEIATLSKSDMIKMAADTAIMNHIGACVFKNMVRFTGVFPGDPSSRHYAENLTEVQYHFELENWHDLNIWAFVDTVTYKVHNIFCTGLNPTNSCTVLTDTAAFAIAQQNGLKGEFDEWHFNFIDEDNEAHDSLTYHISVFQVKSKKQKRRGPRHSPYSTKEYLINPFNGEFVKRRRKKYHHKTGLQILEW